MEKDNFKNTIHQNLRRIREKSGLSTTELAEILGVSQAKISYIENGKGILSAADVAVLSRKLNIPVTEFFQGLNDADETGSKELIHHLVRYGATLLAKPRGIATKPIPFEDVFVRSLSFLDEPRLQQAFHAALIRQTSSQELHSDRIFAQIGGSPFLLSKALSEVRLAQKVIRELSQSRMIAVSPRSRRQLIEFEREANAILAAAGWNEKPEASDDDNAAEIVAFVAECLHAKK